jgi:hypothetical protein
MTSLFEWGLPAKFSWQVLEKEYPCQISVQATVPKPIRRKKKLSIRANFSSFEPIAPLRKVLGQTVFAPLVGINNKQQQNNIGGTDEV